MAGNKYLERDVTSGRMKEVVSNDTSAGVADAGNIVALNAAGDIDASMLPPGVAANSVILDAFEALAANDLVEIFDNAGASEVRLASAASGTVQPTCGFVLAAVLINDPAEVFFEGRVPAVGLTPGQRVYLSTSTPGGIQTTPPTGTGNISQYVGKATDTTEFNFEADDVIELA